MAFQRQRGRVKRNVRVEILLDWDNVQLPALFSAMGGRVAQDQPVAIQGEH